MLTMELGIPPRVPLKSGSENLIKSHSMSCRYAARMAARRDAAAKDSSETTANGQPNVPKDVIVDRNNGMHPMPKEEV